MGLERFFYFFLRDGEGRERAYRVRKDSRDPAIDVESAEQDMETPLGPRAGRNGRGDE